MDRVEGIGRKIRSVAITAEGTAKYPERYVYFTKTADNGVQPCQEAGNLRFRYDSSFSYYTLGDDTNGTYYFYLNAGENTIRLETTLGDLGDLLADAQTSLTQLNTAYRRILMITGSSPDLNRDYMLDTMVPDALQIIRDESANLTQLEARFIEVFGKSSSAQLSSLKSMMLILEQMNSDHTKIKSIFTDFKDAIAAMGTWINDMSKIRWSWITSSLLPRKNWLRGCRVQLPISLKALFMKFVPLSHPLRRTTIISVVLWRRMDRNRWRFGWKQA